MVDAIETEAGTVMVGDVAFKYGNLEGYLPGLAASLTEGDRTYQRIRSQAAHFIPIYDPEVLRRYPNGEIS